MDPVPPPSLLHDNNLCPQCRQHVPLRVVQSGLRMGQRYLAVQSSFFIYLHELIIIIAQCFSCTPLRWYWFPNTDEGATVPPFQSPLPGAPVPVLPAIRVAPSVITSAALSMQQQPTVFSQDRHCAMVLWIFATSAK
jgi:hypothetical protein